MSSAGGNGGTAPTGSDAERLLVSQTSSCVEKPDLFSGLLLHLRLFRAISLRHRFYLLPLHGINI